MFWNFFFCLLRHIIGARYYDPELGIWLSVDPEEQFYNLYGYANNPLIMVDPDGTLFGIDDALAAIIVGAVIGATAGGISGYQTAEAAGATGGQKFGYIFGGAVIGGLIGGVTGGAGAGVTSGVSAGLTATQIGALGAGSILNTTMAGAVGGALSGAIGGGLSGWAFGGVSNGSFFSGSKDQILEGMKVGVKFGALTGAVGGALRSNDFNNLLEKIELSEGLQHVGEKYNERIATKIGEKNLRIGKFDVKINAKIGKVEYPFNIGDKLIKAGQGIEKFSNAISSKFTPVIYYGSMGNMTSLLNLQHAFLNQSYGRMWGNKATQWFYRSGEGIYLNNTYDLEGEYEHYKELSELSARRSNSF